MSKPTASGRLACALLLAAFVVAGGALRYVGLANRSLHHDEPATVLFAQGKLAYDAPEIRATLADLLVARWSLAVFGFSEWSVRLPFFAAGVLSLALVGVLAWTYAGRESGVLAAAIVSLHPWHVYYSQYARYPILVFLFATLLLLGRGWVERPRRRAAGAALMIVAAVCGLASHAFFVLLLLSIGVPDALRLAMPRLRDRSVGVAVALFVAGSVLLVAALPTVRSRLDLGMAILAGNALRALVYLSPVCILLAAFFLLSGARDGRYQRDYLARTLVICALLFAALQVMARIPDRYYGWVLPPLLVAGAVFGQDLLEKLPVRHGMAALAAAAMLLAAMHLPQFVAYHLHSGYKPGGKECLAYIRAHWQPGDLLVTTGIGDWLVDVYWPNARPDTCPFSKLVEKQLAGHRRAWFWYNSLTAESATKIPRRFPSAEIRYVVPGGTPFEPYATTVMCAEIGGPPRQSGQP